VSFFGRWDKWQPSLTWWVLGSVLIAFAVADILNVGNYNREIMVLGLISFVGMILEITQRRWSSARRAQHG
jgi:hypothetical protein